MGDFFSFILVPLGYVMRWLYSLTNNYLAAILLFTLLVEILLIPLAIKQQKNQIKQASLAPKVAAINKKYAGRTDQATNQKKQQEIMDMYQSEHFNPAGGCLPLLIQLPIIMILYGIIRQPLTYISMLTKDAITSLSGQLTNLGHTIVNGDEISMIKYATEEGIGKFSELSEKIIPQMNIGSFNLSDTPRIEFNPFNWLMLIPILTFVVMIVTQKITQKFSYQPPEQADAQNKLSMKIMMYAMPLLSVYIEFQLPALIGIYWIFRSILQTVERIIISKLMPLPKYTEEDYKAAEKEVGKNSVKSRKKSENFVRSLHHIDDEEYIERHKEELQALEEAEAKKNQPKKLIPPKKNKAEKDEGTVTDSANAPAAIKNDEKTNYKKK